LVDDAGVTNTLSITPTDLPDGVIALSTVLVRAGDPPFGATPDSGTQFALSDFTQASSSVGLVDGRSFALQKATGQPTTGKAALVYTYVNDAGTSAAEGKRYEAHGTLDATLPYVFGSQPDGGTFDAGRTVLLHAEF
ncbi:MAG: hypothetical protein JST92_22640, partial [Deltaproteobacteria bacterium]|nr:hypothetical protein [Deltaproteobacteria bacterium]